MIDSSRTVTPKRRYWFEGPGVAGLRALKGW